MVFIMKKYFVYIESGADLMKLAIPAESVKSAKKYANGNGDIIKVTDVTADYPISADKVSNALKNAGFGQVEIDFIIRTLTMNEIAE